METLCLRDKEFLNEFLTICFQSFVDLRISMGVIVFTLISAEQQFNLVLIRIVNLLLPTSTPLITGNERSETYKCVQ